MGGGVTGDRPYGWGGGGVDMLTVLYIYITVTSIVIYLFVCQAVSVRRSIKLLTGFRAYKSGAVSNPDQESHGASSHQPDLSRCSNRARLLQLSRAMLMKLYTNDYVI